MIDVGSPGSLTTGRQKKWPEAEDGTPFYINIMGDPRVYRGPVHGRRAAVTVTSQTGAAPASIAKRKRARSLKLPSLDELHKSIHAEREFKPVPIHLYLEEQYAERADFSDQSLQTDSFLPSAPERPYVPAKIGLDIGTQIDPDSGDLFSFDEAIGATVRVIVCKTIEQSLLEVRMESELALLADRKTAANNAQNERDRIANEIEHNASRERIQTERLVQSQRARAREEAAAIHKSNCQKIARQYLSAIQTTVLQSLVAKGYLYSRSQAEVTDNFVPWLARNVAELVTIDKSLKFGVIDDILRSALMTSTKSFRDEVDQANRKREEIRALEKLRSIVVNLHLRLPEMEGRLLGPVPVRNGQTIADAKTAVRLWLTQNAPDLAEEYAEWQMQFSYGGISLPFDRVIVDIGLNNLATLDLSLRMYEVLI